MNLNWRKRFKKLFLKSVCVYVRERYRQIDRGCVYELIIFSKVKRFKINI